jgi:CheY-like chemotaxis protein
VVDDNQDAVDIAVSALSSVGAQVRPFTSPAEAVEDFSRARPDIVLCDIAMPGMDGFEVLARIRGLEIPEGTTTPVLAVTAFASVESYEQCARAGFQGHIAKPYDATELIRQIAETLTRV